MDGGEGMIRKLYEWWLGRKKDKIIYIANLLLRELQAAGYKTELSHISKGFHSVDISVHRNEELTLHNINGIEIRGTYQK